MPGVTGRVIESSELLVTELFVEPARLKAKRVKPRRVTAAVSRKGFRASHQFAPDPAAAQRVGHPEILDEQPSAIGIAGEPGSYSGPLAQKDRHWAPRRVLRPLAFIVGLQAIWQYIDIGFGGRIFNRQPIPRAQLGNGNISH